MLGARRLERLQTLTEELSLGSDAAVQTDVTLYAQVKHLVDHAEQAHGRIDVIINNAGLTGHGIVAARPEQATASILDFLARQE